MSDANDSGAQTAVAHSPGMDPHANGSNGAAVPHSDVPPPPPSGVMFVHPGLLGDPYAVEESEAGDAALPLHLEELDPQNDTTVEDPVRKQYWTLLNTRELVGKVLKYLRGRHGYPYADAYDILQRTFLRAWSMSRMPDLNRPLYPWLRCIANKQRLTFYEKQGDVAKSEVRVEDITTFAKDPDPIEARIVDAIMEWIDRLAAKDEKGAVDAAILKGKLAGRPWEELAREAKLSTVATKQRYYRRLGELKKKFPEVGMAIAAAFAALFLYLGYEPPEPVHTVSAGNVEQARESPLPSADTGITPDDTRLRGLSLCETGHYAICLEFLDRAVARDPAQAKRPDVIKWRAEAEKALHPKGAPQAP